MTKWNSSNKTKPNTTAPTIDTSIVLEPHRMPKHVAIIMDGNGRWAQERGIPRAKGHRAGVDALRNIVKTCTHLHIPMLTVFAFSTENWERPRKEVNFLMHLLNEVLERDSEDLHKNGVSIKIIGSRDKLSDDILKAIELVEEKTAKNTALQLNVAWNYGGRAEICNATRLIAEKVVNGTLQADQIDEVVFSDHLQTNGMPDPDLLIRTGGEFRISNFLLWQIAYSEIWVTKVHWPDFDSHMFRMALYDYQRRERRFGGV